MTGQIYHKIKDLHAYLDSLLMQSLKENSDNTNSRTYSSVTYTCLLFESIISNLSGIDPSATSNSQQTLLTLLKKLTKGLEETNIIIDSSEEITL